MLELEKSLIYNELGRLIANYILTNELDFKDIIDSKSAEILNAVKNIVSNEQLSDFEKIDDIVTLLNAYDIDTNNCHDF